MTLTYVKRRLEADNVWSLYFKPNTPVRYIAGQFIELTIEHDHDERGQMHWFTLSSSPHQELLRITTRKPKSRSSSFKQQLFALKPGDTVVASSPMGDFVLPKDIAIPLVFVAIGIGITPFISILDWLESQGKSRDITLLYKVNSEDEYPFIKELQKYTDIDFRPTTNHIESIDIAELAGSDGGSLVYMAGPEEVVEVITKDLTAKYIKPEQVVTDYFPGYA